jgi:hypothetical protein
LRPAEVEYLVFRGFSASLDARSAPAAGAWEENLCA